MFLKIKKRNTSINERLVLFFHKGYNDCLRSRLIQVALFYSKGRKGLTYDGVW